MFIIERAIINTNNIKILEPNCELIGRKTISCQLTNVIKINGDTGIINGYIIVEDSSQIANLMCCEVEQTKEKFKDTHIYHVYDSIQSNIKLKVQNITFHNIYLNRYRSENIFYFLGKITLEDLYKFEMEVLNGTESVGQIERRSSEHGSSDSGV